MPQQIKQTYCQYRRERVDSTLYGSKNGSTNNVCLMAGDCKKFCFCEAINIPKDKIKTTYVKCCGICQRLNYCKYRRKSRKAVEPTFIKSKERDYPERDYPEREENE
jgi:hypothetical protein